METEFKLIFDSDEEYARRWAKKEDVEVDTLSEWVKTVMFLVNRRASVLSRTVIRRHESVFDDPDVAAELAEIHVKFVVVPAGKASNNIVFICKTYYINCLMEELGMSIMTGNPTYNPTTMSKDESQQNHHSVMLTFGISLPEEDIDLPKLYWIHKNPYKQRYFAGSAKCSTKKKVREKSRECHNHKPQPFPDPKRKRKPTNPNKHKPNKRTKSTKISSLFPKRGNRNTKKTEKTQEQNDTRNDIQQIAS